MLASVTTLLVCQLVGEAAAVAFGLPVPGPVIGMALLFVGLCVAGRVPEQMQRTTSGLLEHLSLLFVPAGVGVVAYLGLLAEQWAPIAVVLVVSTLATIAVTGLLMDRLAGHGDMPRRGGRA